jgi:hypothetical protein
MAPSLTVLLLGPSGILETEDGATGTMADMMRESLEGIAPDVAWSCRPQVFFISEQMAERALKAVRSQKPEAVVVMMGSPAFADDFVVYRLRELFPPVFGPSLKLSRLVKGLAGGAGEGSASARGAIFRLPRRVGVRLIGAAPVYRLDDALRYSRETIDTLVRLEDVAVVCRGGVANPQFSDSAGEHRRRVEAYNAALGEYCRERHVPFYAVQDAMAADGHEIGFLAPGGHISRFTRRFDSATAATLVARSLLT